jgi:hypothetical protein
MTVAQTVPVERRSVFLERVGAMLRMLGYGHFTDSDVSDVARLATCGLVHTDPWYMAGTRQLAQTQSDLANC